MSASRPAVSGLREGRQVDYRVQHFDYSGEQVGEVDLDAAKGALLRFAWDEEVGRFVSELRKGQDVCPPGVTFALDERHKLRIYSDEPGSFRVYCIVPAAVVQFGVRIPRSRSLETRGLTRQELPGILEMYFEGRYEELISRLAT